ncbi:uncharacterized protein isoform X2 [Musca autumnalis]
MGASTVRAIIRQTCETLWQKLSPVVLPVPSTADWAKIAEDFEEKWNFPHCVGAIDGKHINIKCPAKSGSMYYNHKSTYSIVLLAVCDGNYKFTVVDIGAYGSQSDGGILRNSEFGKRLLENNLGLPEDEQLQPEGIKIPYFFVGDAAFPLRDNLMRPYPGSFIPHDREVFNMRLSRARRTIENSFGILTVRWRILLSNLYVSPDAAELIVKATVVLHNYLKVNDECYCPEIFAGDMDGKEGLWRNEIVTSNNISSIGRKKLIMPPKRHFT